MTTANDGSRRTVALRVAYDGAPYHGFVLQQARLRTVASDLLEAIRQIDGEVAELRAASRTDAGVHARDQLVAFDTGRRMPMRGWVLELCARLPRTVAVRAAFEAPPGYNPRFECAWKSYRYLVHAERVPDPLLAARAWRVGQLEGASDDVLERMDRELALARGEHDFTAFASAADVRQHTIRTIAHTAVHRLKDDPRVIALDVRGDGFLHNMVRILAGTVVDVGRGQLEPGVIRRALDLRDRRAAGQTAPPDGLYLERLWLERPLTGERWP